MIDHLIHFRLYLFSYSLEFTYRFAEPYHLCFHIFNPWWQRQSRIPYSSKLFYNWFFVTIYGDNPPPLYNQTPGKYGLLLTHMFTLYLGYTKKKLSLLLVLKGCHFLLIVFVIKNISTSTFHSSYLGNKMLY